MRNTTLCITTFPLHSITCWNVSIKSRLEIDMEKIFTDESNETTSPSLQIDFSEALWVTDKLNFIFHKAGIPLNDVDFIAETDEELIFVECKNANRIDAAKPDVFFVT